MPAPIIAGVIRRSPDTRPDDGDAILEAIRTQPPPENLTVSDLVAYTVAWIDHCFRGLDNFSESHREFAQWVDDLVIKRRFSLGAFIDSLPDAKSASVREMLYQAYLTEKFGPEEVK